MKILEIGEKINFIDENNVFVGYDLGQNCCENASWFISLDDYCEDHPEQNFNEYAWEDR